MNTARSTNRNIIALNIRALVIGVVVATVLVAGYTLIEGSVAEYAAGHPFLVPPVSQALFALLYSLMVAPLLAICCVPFWLVLRKLRLDRGYAAAALGFLAVITYWVLDNLGAGSILELLRSGLIYAVCGAVAGTTTWWAMQPKS